ncbi:MAG: LIC12162 family protein [Bacteroidia bacterium]|jgi:putative transferase (TIGR04331 family)
MGQPRFLITTADERTWKKNEPVLFLGEWCKIYRRTEAWKDMDFKVAAPYGLEKDIKEHDRLLIQSTGLQLLKEVTVALNAFHNTNHSERYWNIVLGHWLQRFVSVACNRYFCLEKVYRENEINGTYIFNKPEYTLATNTSVDFQWALYDNVWNHTFYARILKFWNVEQFTSLTLNEEESVGFKIENHHLPDISLKHKILTLWSRFCEKLVRKRDALIINSYLPFSQALKLQLSLFQFPGFWSHYPVSYYPVNKSARKQFTLKVEKLTGFDRFVRELLPEAMPTCYLEGYKDLVQKSEQLPWPFEPKFIFTSNNFDTDEQFKIWAAEKVVKGAKYHIGQHGNLYGTWRYHSSDIPEFATPDSFITWGWTNDDPKVKPAFIFRTMDKMPMKQITGEKLLLIERCIYNRLATYDRYVNHGIYQEEQFRFVNALNNNVQQELHVRLSMHKLGNLQWSDEQRWKDYNPELQLDKGSTPLWNLIDKSKLVVHSYDSTGLLETLSLNIPTMAFWYELYDEIVEEAQPYYKMLEEAGIIASTPEIAAERINAHWDDMGAWWYSDKVQQARKRFCDKYARHVDNPIQTLKTILTGG